MSLSHRSCREATHPCCDTCTYFRLKYPVKTCGSWGGRATHQKARASAFLGMSRALELEPPSDEGGGDLQTGTSYEGERITCKWYDLPLR